MGLEVSLTLHDLDAISVLGREIRAETYSEFLSCFRTLDATIPDDDFPMPIPMRDGAWEQPVQAAPMEDLSAAMVSEWKNAAFPDEEPPHPSDILRALPAPPRIVTDDDGVELETDVTWVDASLSFECTSSLKVDNFVDDEGALLEPEPAPAVEAVISNSSMTTGDWGTVDHDNVARGSNTPAATSPAARLPVAHESKATASSDTSTGAASDASGTTMDVGGRLAGVKGEMDGDGAVLSSAETNGRLDSQSAGADVGDSKANDAAPFPVQDANARGITSGEGGVGAQPECRAMPTAGPSPEPQGEPEPEQRCRAKVESASRANAEPALVPGVMTGSGRGQPEPQPTLESESESDSDDKGEDTLGLRRERETQPEEGAPGPLPELVAPGLVEEAEAEAEGETGVEGEGDGPKKPVEPKKLIQKLDRSAVAEAEAESPIGVEGDGDGEPEQDILSDADHLGDVPGVTFDSAANDAATRRFLTRGRDPRDADADIPVVGEEYEEGYSEGPDYIDNDDSGGEVGPQYGMYKTQNSSRRGDNDGEEEQEGEERVYRHDGKQPGYSDVRGMSFQGLGSAAGKEVNSDDGDVRQHGEDHHGSGQDTLDGGGPNGADDDSHGEDGRGATPGVGQEGGQGEGDRKAEKAACGVTAESTAVDAGPSSVGGASASSGGVPRAASSVKEVTYDEVEPFALDPDFDYDNVVCTGKLDRFPGMPPWCKGV